MQPYQWIDYALGTTNIEEPPAKVWVIREAGTINISEQSFPNGMAVFMTADPDEATEVYCYALACSKYPKCVELTEAWLHSQQRIFGQISNRKFWSLR